MLSSAKNERSFKNLSSQPKEAKISPKIKKPPPPTLLKKMFTGRPERKPFCDKKFIGAFNSKIECSWPRAIEKK